MTGIHLEPARRPTMYFIGVSTARSMIMRVFPAWAQRLGLGDCVIRGIDLRRHDEPQRYREVVSFIRDDPLSLGALVTTHKIDLLRAARELFDSLDEHAAALGEVSSIAKRDGKLLGAAKDPITSGLALEAFLPTGHWAASGAEALLLGAGGSSAALSCYLAHSDHGTDRPSRIVVSNRSAARLEEMRAIHRRLSVDLPLEYALTPSPADNDRLLRGLAPGSLVANATGLGKDEPGSPLTDDAVFPSGAYAWDFNYRGDLAFLRQARAQAGVRELHVEDGWRYFVHGWLAVIGEVFGRDIPSRGPIFEELSSIAAREREG